MNSNSILTCNLLDILFENRNKDYGAYVLRKGYNKRLFNSLVMTLGLALMFIFLLMFSRKNGTTNLNIVPFIPDPSISAIRPIEKIVEAKKHVRSDSKSVEAVDNKALIIDNKDEKTEPTKFQLTMSTVDDNTACLLKGLPPR